MTSALPLTLPVLYTFMPRASAVAALFNGFNPRHPLGEKLPRNQIFYATLTLAERAAALVLTPPQRLTILALEAETVTPVARDRFLTSFTLTEDFVPACALEAKVWCVGPYIPDADPIVTLYSTTYSQSRHVLSQTFGRARA